MQSGPHWRPRASKLLSPSGRVKQVSLSASPAVSSQERTLGKGRENEGKQVSRETPAPRGRPQSQVGGGAVRDAEPHGGPWVSQAPELTPWVS